MVHEPGLTLTSVYAHANLLDSTSPDRYGTAGINKAIKLAQKPLRSDFNSARPPRTASGRGTAIRG